MEAISRRLLPLECCSARPALDRRPILAEDEASGLAALFKTFSNSTRLRLLHALVRSGELCVSDLARATEMKPQAVSNQLQRLVDRGILASRRGGNNVLYRIVDPCVRVLLDRGLCLLECPAGSHDVEPSEARVASGIDAGECDNECAASLAAAGQR